jgi:hypothetical protein
MAKSFGVLLVVVGIILIITGLFSYAAGDDITGARLALPGVGLLFISLLFFDKEE